MRLGHAARKAGRTAEALAHYRSALDAEPDSAEANSVYGLMLLQLGRAGEAETPLRRAVEIAPTHAALRMNLARWLDQQQRVDEAVEIVTGVVADEPSQHWAHERLGELKAKQKRFGDAAEHFRRAAELQPNDPSLLYKLARASFDDGRAADAERILERVLKYVPANAAVLRLYADLHESRANWAALEASANAWIALQPLEPAAWRALAKAQWEAGYPRRAMPNFQKSLALGGRTAGPLTVYGRLCMLALELDEAQKALDEAEALAPENAAMLAAKSVLYMWQGRHGEALDYGRRALRANPGDATAFKTLAELTDGRLDDDEFAALRQLAESEGTRPNDRITASYALGDCLDARGDFEGAFAAYENANRLAHQRASAEGLLYDAAARTSETAKLASLFGAPSARASEEPGPRPIFILGMPRSGTTLIESVLAAHSRVVAGGESGGIRWILPEFLGFARQTPDFRMSEEQRAKWRATYWQLMPRHEGAVAVTDKNPWNFDAFGLILDLFPNARLIHVRRNPVDTGFSIFRHEFSKLVRFTSRLEDIGHYYGEYARVMAHWERVAGDRFTTIQYEDFVRGFDAAAPALIAACGLEWEDACARFWENPRAVSTISTMQVRRPPTKPSTPARAYADKLAPLTSTLESMGVDLETGAWRGGS